MERRLYFVVGDLLAAASVGAVAGLAACGAVAVDSNMLLAMLVGMVVGMAVSVPVSFLFMPFFGAMEVMVPVMLAGMLSGMWIGMAEAMQDLGGASAAGWGMLIGLLALAASSIADATLRGRG